MPELRRADSVTGRQPPMTAVPVERTLPGEPIPREELIRQYEQWRWANLKEGPGRAVIFDLLVPKPEDTYQWRIQLDCGCVRDVVTTADTVECLMARSAKYWGGDDEIRLPAGQWLCADPKCPRYRTTGGPVRDITEWTTRREKPTVMEALVIDGETVLPERTCAHWTVVLDCGHHDTRFTDLDWAPEKGVAHRQPKTPLVDMLKELCKDADDEQYWRRMYAETLPTPTPFVQCRTCARTRSVTGYQRIGWVVPKPKAPRTPKPPKPPSRRSLQMKIRKLEREADRLREELSKLDSSD